MQGLTLRNKPRTPHRDTFRAYLDIRPHCEPNCIWPFTQNLHQLKRQDANKETITDYYLASFSSVYADDLVIKSKPKKIQNKDKFDANSSSKVFGADVRGYSTENLNSGDEFTEVFSKTKTLENPLNARTKAKEHLEEVKKAREPRVLSADIVDLILSKAQAVDPNQLETIDSVDRLSRQNSETDICEPYIAKAMVEPPPERPRSKMSNQYWYRDHVHK